MVHSCDFGTGRQALKNVQKFCLCALRMSVNVSLYYTGSFYAFFLQSVFLKL